MTRTIRVSDVVWEAIQKRAAAFTDTPDSVLRRALGMDQEQSRRPKTDRCLGLTLAGKQCSRSSQRGTKFCGHHFNQQE